MKRVFYIDSDEYLNGEKMYGSHGSYHCWHYTDVPEIEPEIYTDFEEVVNKIYWFNSIHLDCTLFAHKPFLIGRLNLDEDIKVFKKDFKELKVVYRIGEPYSYTMEELMKKLSAEEFIEYCKDHGLNVYPMK